MLGAAAGLVIAVQAAADMHVAQTLQQGMFAIGDGAGADVQGAAGGDDAGVVVGGVDLVAQGAGAERDIVAVDAAEVAQLGGADDGVGAAVDEAAVVELACAHAQIANATEGGCVGEAIGGAQAGFATALVDDVAVAVVDVGGG